MKLIAIWMILIGFCAASGSALAGSSWPTPLAKTASNSANLFQSGISAYEQENYSVALKVFTELAEQGDADAQVNLGDMYYKGEGVPSSKVQAAKWFYLAKAGGRTTLDELIQLVESQMSHQQIEQAQALAAEWWQKRH